MTVVDWLLDSDPALRWQVLRDDDGRWAGGACFPAAAVTSRTGSRGPRPTRR